MSKLTLNYTGIGSVPLKSENAPKEALDFIFKEFKSVPFWPQLPHFIREEDMIFQYTQNLCGLNVTPDKYYLEAESEEFFIKLEELFLDYETILACNDLFENEQILDKYAILPPNSNAILPFIEGLKTQNPDFVKGSITGPFTFSTSINDIDGKCAYYNEVLREVCVKTLCLKALWQVKEFKKSAPCATPIIFMDEPSISQIGSCAFLSVKNEDVTQMLSEISSALKKFGAISGVHCCGKADWDIVLKSNLDVINFDAYFYAQSLANFAPSVKEFLKNGGWLAFGIVPTLDKEALNVLDEKSLEEKFEQALNCFIKKGFDRKEILERIFITPSCGCGSLDENGAIKALLFTKKLSQYLKEKTEVKL